MNEINDYDYIINAFTKEGNNTNLEVDNLKVGCITSKDNKFSLDSDGNLVVKSITTESGASLDFNAIYPVGSIYMSVATTSPNVLFGGEWEQIKDTFLLACGDTYENGSTGGEATHVLTVNEMPSHTHTISLSGTHSHTSRFKEVPYNSSNTYSYDCARKTSATYDTTGTVVSGDGGHTHTPTNTGGGLAHENMPPYLTVYVWKRTA